MNGLYCKILQAGKVSFVCSKSEKKQGFAKVIWNAAGLAFQRSSAQFIQRFHPCAAASGVFAFPTLQSTDRDQRVALLGPTQGAQWGPDWPSLELGHYVQCSENATSSGLPQSKKLVIVVSLKKSRLVKQDRWYLRRWTLTQFQTKTAIRTDGKHAQLAFEPTLYLALPIQSGCRVKAAESQEYPPQAPCTCSEGWKESHTLRQRHFYFSSWGGKGKNSGPTVKSPERQARKRWKTISECKTKRHRCTLPCGNGDTLRHAERQT